MKRATTLGLSILFALTPLAAAPQGPRAMAEEKAEHPRIARAIHELEDAIAYLEAAPHDFGGHKAEAIRASKEALHHLRAALAYRARREGK
jgi:hypothetical protein